MKQIKIFGIGSPKTGTSSLGEAFRMLGYKHQSWDAALWEKYEQGDFEPIFQIAKQHESFEDGPWNGPDLYSQKGPDFYKLLDKRFPRSKFILTIREAGSWSKSHEAHFSTAGSRRIPQKYWIDKYDRLEMLARYQKRNDAIINYFKDRPDDLLIMNVCAGDGWKTLCPFLGIEPVDTLFPHENKTKRRKTAMQTLKEYIQTRLA